MDRPETRNSKTYVDKLWYASILPRERPGDLNDGAERCQGDGGAPVHPRHREGPEEVREHGQAHDADRELSEAHGVSYGHPPGNST